MPEIDSGYFWIIIGAIAVGTYAIKLSFLEVFHHVEEIPPWLEQALKYTPAAVLAAIILPRLVLIQGDPMLSVGNERLLAGTLAFVVAWRTRSMAATMVVGLVSLWVLGSVL